MTKRTLALLLSVVLAPSLALAETSTWTIDPNHTATSFSVKHLVISTVRGHFGKTTGTLELDERDITRSRVQASVDATTVDTRVANRDRDLRSPQFFDVENHPRITFKSTRVQKVSDDQLQVEGDLTLKGTTKPVIFLVNFTPQPVKGSRGEMRMGFTATSKINRKEFGLNYNAVVEAGPVVSDEVALLIEGEFVRDAPAANKS